MGKRRHKKNKKRKMIGGEGGKGNYSSWKNVRDLYSPVHRDLEQKTAEKESKIPFSQRATSSQNGRRRSPRQPRIPHTRRESQSQLRRKNVDSMTFGNTIDIPVDHDEVISSEQLIIESDVDQSNILNEPSDQWTIKNLYGIRGGARRKSKSSKKKRKQKRKTQKRKSSNKRKYTKRR